MVHHNSESSLVVEVKSKHYLDPLLMQLKELVSRKLNESFSHGENDVIRYQGRLCVPSVDDLRRKLLKKLMVCDIPFIQVPPICIMIFKKSIGGKL